MVEGLGQQYRTQTQLILLVTYNIRVNFHEKLEFVQKVNGACASKTQAALLLTN